MNSIVQFDSNEFSKVLNKNKDEVIADMEKDMQIYETAAKLCIEAHDEDIKEIEKLVTSTSTQAVQANSSTMVDQWTQFRSPNISNKGLITWKSQHFVRTW